MAPETKFTKHLHELKGILQNDDKKSISIVEVFELFRNKKLDTFFVELKSKGAGFSELLLKLILMSVSQMTVFRCVKVSGSTNHGAKDAYYAVKNNPMIAWRTILIMMFHRFEYLTRQNKAVVHGLIRCLIADDTTLPKRGKRIEGISRVWDHVFHRSVLGFKGLFLALSDGKSFLPFDFSIHNEKGKNPQKPFGMKKKDLKARYSKPRNENAPGLQRKQTLIDSKVAALISMLKEAFSKGVKAEYLLVDSWFTCEELIRFIFEKPAIYFLGMCKMGNAKYEYNGKLYSAKQLLNRCKHTMKAKRSRYISARYYVIDVGYKNMMVRLYFSQYGKQRTWNLLLTDNLHLLYDNAIKIYQIRWGIEVFFKEAKQYLRLGKCQSNDFDAQIADISIIMMTYIILSLKRRFQAYETIGGAFREIQHELIEETLAERLWGLFIEILSSVFPMLEIDPDALIDLMLQDDRFENSFVNFLAESLQTESARKAA
ncbi:MAG TPA: transposase [Bacteroidales bacterium]|nr:transposase [Bacteroidales bacterium]